MRPIGPTSSGAAAGHVATAVLGRPDGPASPGLACA